MQGSKFTELELEALDHTEEEEEELAVLVQLYAARRAQAIIRREGASLILAAQSMDENAIEANRRRLATSIAKAIADAYSGDIEGDAADGLDGP